MEQFGTFIQPLHIKYILYGMIGTIVTFTIPLFIILIIHKLRVEKREQRLKELEQLYLKMLTMKLENPEYTFINPVSEIEFEALGNALADMGINNSSPQSAHLRIIARSTGLDTWYQDFTTSRSWTKRYSAIEKLGFLKFPELEPFFLSILAKEKEPHVLAKTLWALSLVATIDDLPIINKFLNDPLFTSAKFKEYIYTNILQAFRERGEIPVFITWFEETLHSDLLPLSLKKDIIEACGAEKLVEAGDLICDFFTSHSDAADLKIACIRALESIGGTQSCSIVLGGLQDQDWRIRAVAAKHAEICARESLPLLEALLHDANYQVRINAAQTLLRLGEQGVAILRQGTRSDDRFVRDITNFILAEVSHA